LRRFAADGVSRDRLLAEAGRGLAVITDEF